MNCLFSRIIYYGQKCIKVCGNGRVTMETKFERRKIFVFVIVAERTFLQTVQFSKTKM